MTNCAASRCRPGLWMATATRSSNAKIPTTWPPHPRRRRTHPSARQPFRFLAGSGPVQPGLAAFPHWAGACWYLAQAKLAQLFLKNSTAWQTHRGGAAIKDAAWQSQLRMRGQVLAMPRAAPWASCPHRSPTGSRQYIPPASRSKALGQVLPALEKAARLGRWSDAERSSAHRIGELSAAATLTMRATRVLKKQTFMLSQCELTSALRNVSGHFPLHPALPSFVRAG